MRTTAAAAAFAAGVAIVAGLGLAVAPSAGAAEVVVLSAGAVEPGLRPVLAAFERESGHTVRLSFAAAPALREALRGPAAADVVVAPLAVLDEAKTAAPTPPGAARVAIGRVGIGVAVRSGAAEPDVSSVAALRADLDRADAIVFNRASTGLHVEKALPALGLSPAATSRIERVPDGAAVLRRLLEGRAAREVGFAAMTEIGLFREQGIRLVGPAPGPLQNETTYAAAAWRDAAAPSPATSALLSHLAAPAQQATLRGAGVAAP